MSSDLLTPGKYRAQVVANDLGLHHETYSDLVVHGEALFSADGTYRYLLSRRWGTGGPSVTFVMLNPSVATAREDDPTIRRCLDYARRWDCRAMQVVNLFAYRATQPRELRTAKDPVGPHNDRILLSVCEPTTADTRNLVVAAWGAHGVHNLRGQEVTSLLTTNGVTLQCLAITKTRQPGHPLYLPADRPLRTYRDARS